MLDMNLFRVVCWYYDGGPQLIGPTVQTKTYTLSYCYEQYMVLFSMVPRNSGDARGTVVNRTKYC